MQIYNRTRHQCGYWLCLIGYQFMYPAPWLPFTECTWWIQVQVTRVNKRNHYRALQCTQTCKAVHLEGLQGKARAFVYNALSAMNLISTAQVDCSGMTVASIANTLVKLSVGWASFAIFCNAPETDPCCLHSYSSRRYKPDWELLRDFAACH